MSTKSPVDLNTGGMRSIGDGAASSLMKRATFANRSAGEKQGGIPTKPTRMGWLYDMVASHGIVFQFSVFSRSWIKQRYAAADVSTRRGRKLSSWWEDDKDSSATTKQTVQSEQETEKAQVEDQKARSKNLEEKKAAGGGAASKTTLEEVLSDRRCRAEFYDHLEENYQQQNLDFLEAVEMWKKNCFGPSKKSSKDFDMKTFLAKNVYSQYIDEQSETSLQIPSDVKRNLKIRLGIKSKKHSLVGQSGDKSEEKEGEPDGLDQSTSILGASTTASPPQSPLGSSSSSSAISVDSSEPESADDEVSEPSTARSTFTAGPPPKAGDLSEESFDECVGVVNLYLKDEWLQSFLETEEFLDLKAEGGDEKEPSSIPRVTSTDGGGSSESSEGGGSTTFTQDGIEFNNDLEGEREELLPKAKAWWNTGGFRSILVDILDQKVEPPRKRYHAHVTVDSKTVTTPVIKLRFIGADWEQHIKMPIEPTTQYLVIKLYSDKDLLGTALFPLAELVTRAEMKEPEWFKLDWKVVGPPPELSLKINLSKSAVDDRELKELEKMQIFNTEESKSVLSNKIKGAVSKKKLRFKEDGFDLDLRYITPRLLAMGYPSEGTEGMYRNHMKDVQRFFTRRHPEAYKLYNLCSEKKYDPSKFQNSVARYPFDDHNPCAFVIIKAFCEDLRLWLTEHPQNVAAIHCKAGKGRTGTMIACYLIYVGHSRTADAALDFFAEKRTKNKKGVTIPSQIRYVHYWDKYCQLKRLHMLSPGRVTLFVNTVTFHGLPKNLGPSVLYFTIAHPYSEESRRIKLNSSKICHPIIDKASKKVIWDFSKFLVPVEEDVQFVFNKKTKLGKEKIFQVWINTRYVELERVQNGDGEFVTRIIFRKEELDKACKDKKHKAFDSDFTLELTFAETAMSGQIKQLELAGKPFPIPGQFISK